MKITPKLKKKNSVTLILFSFYSLPTFYHNHKSFVFIEDNAYGNVHTRDDIRGRLASL